MLPILTSTGELSLSEDTIKPLRHREESFLRDPSVATLGHNSWAYSVNRVVSLLRTATTRTEVLDLLIYLERTAQELREFYLAKLRDILGDFKGTGLLFTFSIWPTAIPDGQIL